MQILETILSFLTNILSRFFAWVHDQHKEDENLRAKRSELIETLAPNARVLEIGAGSGGTLASGAYGGRTGRFAELVLSEPDNAMRARLSRKVSGNVSGVVEGNVRLMDCALPNLPFGDGEFDAVVLFLVASHVSDRAAAAHEISRILVPGGKLLFIDHGAHDQAHGHGHGHGHGHDHGHAEEQGQEGEDDHGDCSHTTIDFYAKPQPWFCEMFRFLSHARSTGHTSLDDVLKEFRQEKLLNEVFQTRMKVNSLFFKEITYGIFERTQA